MIESSPKEKQVAISLKNLNKSFSVGDQVVRALRDVDLDVYTGESLFIIGPSGCGKTTLLSTLCGALTADSGEIRAFGANLSAMKPRQITRFRAEHVGFIFQQFNLIHTLTAAENAAVPLLIQRIPKREALKTAEEFLERVGIADKRDAFPKHLSGGQQQRIAIARALVSHPQLVVCDEPTSALDSVSGRQVMELLSDIAKESDRCVIIVTHDPRTYPFADRMAEMEDGRILRLLEDPEAIANVHN